jgi:hypothetical protein
VFDAATGAYRDTVQHQSAATVPAEISLQVIRYDPLTCAKDLHRPLATPNGHMSLQQCLTCPTTLTNRVGTSSHLWDQPVRRLFGRALPSGRCNPG